MYPLIFYAAIIVIARISLIELYQALVKAFNCKIYDVPFDVNQEHREDAQYMWGIIMDVAFLFLFFYLFKPTLHSGNLEAILIIILAHVFVVEPIYYFYHRVLHHKFIYVRHHLHHHRSRVTTPVTSFTFTLFERFTYTLLFFIPIIALWACNSLSYVAILIYAIVFDLLNSIGHLNREIFPKGYHKSFFWYLFYTPTFHALHHSRFRVHYSLFMPFFDYLFGTYEGDTKDIFISVKNGKPLKKITQRVNASLSVVNVTDNTP